MENNKSKEYFAQDEAGNTLFLLDKDHEIQKTYGYNAFGIILKETGSDGKLSNRLTNQYLIFLNLILIILVYQCIWKGFFN